MPTVDGIMLAGSDKDWTVEQFKSGLAALGDAVVADPSCCEAPLKFSSISLPIILVCIGTNFFVS